MTDLENKIVLAPPLNEEEEMKRIQLLSNIFKGSLFFLFIPMFLRWVPYMNFVLYAAIVGFIIGMGCFIAAAVRASRIKKLLITRSSDPAIKWDMLAPMISSSSAFNSLSSSSYESSTPNFVQPTLPTLTQVPTMAENPVPNSGMQGYGPFGLYTGQTNPWP